MLSQPGVPGLPEIPGAQQGTMSLSIFDGDLTLAEISGKVRHLQSKIDDAATRDRAQVRVQQLDQVDKARTMQQERARRDAEEGKRKIDEQMNQALRNCDAQQRQREQQMTQLENMLQRTPTLGHATMQEVAAAAPQSFGPTAYPSAAPGIYAMPAVPPAIP